MGVKEIIEMLENLVKTNKDFLENECETKEGKCYVKGKQWAYEFILENIKKGANNNV